MAAQVALEALHSQHVAFRALSLTTVVLTTTGHILLCDLSHGKFLTDRTFTVCGPPEFWAPEVVKQAGHTEAVDWWALGALLFCLLTQQSPFYSTGASNDIEQLRLCSCRAWSCFFPPFGTAMMVATFQQPRWPQACMYTVRERGSGQQLHCRQRGSAGCRRL